MGSNRRGKDDRIEFGGKFMFEKFKEDLLSTGYIHRPLPLHEEKSLEYLNSNKKVLKSQIICRMDNLDKWTNVGQGEMSFTTERSILGKGSIRLKSPTIMESWPPGAPLDGDYSNYGTVCATYFVGGENWEEYNRIKFCVYPSCDGVRNVHMTFALKNEGKNKIPDIYGREGFHVVNLKNNQWNECTIEVADIPRDKITEISFYYFINGKDTSTGEFMQYDIGGIELELIDSPEISHGWIPSKNRIIYSTTGYSLSRPKTAIASELECEDFQIINSGNGEVVFTGKVQNINTLLGDFKYMDFSSFNAVGEYKIKAGKASSDVFVINNNVWDASIWKTINFLFCERCGFPVPNKHGSCHRDILAVHNGKTLIFNGGWHDAGDVSQQLLQSAEITYSLFEMAEEVKTNDKQLYLRLLEEAEWGLDFLLKTRFGDGYRATSVGITIWSNGLIGDMDDMKARVHNQAYENFLCSGIEAYISSYLEMDDMLAQRALDCAKEDFEFAMKRYEEVGFGERPIFWEHSYMTSESLYMATASWAASMLYKVTKDEYYAEKAVEFINYVVDSQCIEIFNEQYPIRGFFYRDKSKKVIQHFNHQAREHVYMQALVLICETQPEHKKFNLWKKSIELYGDYIKDLIHFVKPYSMLPSGVYKIDEAMDEESFYYQHLLVGDEAKDDYIKQLKNGIMLDEKHYLKRFPVWFSFRGNTAIILSMGKCASLCGNFLKDKDLLSIAEEQLQWLVGKNPFGQSFMYGEGNSYAQQYAVLPGEMAGELPVGIQTKDNEDLPYWPQMNNATYKEVWTTAAGRWLSIISDLYKGEK